MEYNTDTLIALAELTIAFVAFVVIVSSLRITSGEKLTPFEIMLVQFLQRADCYFSALLLSHWSCLSSCQMRVLSQT